MQTNNSKVPHTSQGLAEDVSPLGRASWVAFEWGRNPYFILVGIYIYGPYFQNQIVGDPVLGQALWADIWAYAGLSVALGAPILGAIADAGGPRKPWLLFFSLLLALASSLLWFGQPGGAGLSIFAIGALIVIANVGYDASIVFHGAMLPSIAKEGGIGRLSGVGYALGNLAGLLLLVFVLVFIFLPENPLFGLNRDAHEHERVVGPLAALWFMIFCIPFFLWTPDRKPSGLALSKVVRNGLASVTNTVRSLNQYRNVGAYLLSRMIYNDGLNMMLTFGGIYASGVFGWGVIEIAAYGIVLSPFAALGGFAGGIIADRIGTKTALRLSLSGTILFGFLSLGFAPDRVWFFFSYLEGLEALPLPVFATLPELLYIGAVAGVAICVVATYANSRAMMARIAPRRKMTEFFGLYALSGEATAFAAPLAVGITTRLTDSQQWGMAAILVFLAIGLVGLSFVREEPAEVV
jgi:UMF1 family MFS transporter